MKIALFGGSFNPIHRGHLTLAQTALRACRLDRVVFLPTGHPPHKPADLAPSRHRLHMVRLGIRRNMAFRVSDWEIKRRKTTYTYQALAHFRRRFPKAELFFLMGSDSLRDIPNWRKGWGLLRLCPFLVGRRPGASLPRITKRLRDRVVYFRNPLAPVSGSDLRARCRANRSIRGEVPPAVERYIRRHNLYGSKKSFGHR